MVKFIAFLPDAVKFLFKFFKADPREALKIVLAAIGVLVTVQQTVDLLVPQAVEFLRVIAGTLSGM